jgi:hypothetical protein
MADRNATPSPTSLVLSSEEAAKRAAPGRLPSSLAKANPNGDGPKYTQIGSGSPAAARGQVEHELRRARPDLVAKRAAKGK